MPLTLEQVRLTPYDTCTEIPAGFKVAGDFKTRRAPSPMQYNWYSRWDSPQHLVFHLLATALATKPEGYTIDELKAQFDNEGDKAKVDEIINKFKGSWDHRHTGFDLVVNEAGDRYMLIWRDPRACYAKEIGLEGDFSQVPFQKTPSYVEKVPQLIEEARNPKPVVEKAPKAPKDPAAPKAAKTKSATTESSTAPAGGFLAAFGNVPATATNVQGETIGAILTNAIAQFVDPNAMQIAPDDVNVKVVDRLNQIIDQNGLEAGPFVDFVARYQKETAIKAGFYKICKDLAKKYTEFVKAGGSVAPAAQAPAEAAPATPVAQ